LGEEGSQTVIPEQEEETMNRARSFHPEPPRIVSRCRIRISLLLAVGAALVAAPGAQAGGQAGYGCSPGFDIGAVTVGQFLSLPRNQAGLAAGAYDESSLVSKFTSGDHNGDGVICVKDVAALNGNAGPWQYFYNTADDNASAPTG
jgi:hypothetical protein